MRLVSKSLLMYARLFVVLGMCFVQAKALAQVSAEEHRKHHPNASAAAKDSKPAAAADQAAGGSDTKPAKGGAKRKEPSTPGSATKKPGSKGGGMGKMQPPTQPQEPEELYPQLMALPDLTPQRRAKLIQLARKRMADGKALLSEAVAELSAPAAAGDFAAQQKAAAKVREGLKLFETGLATCRAIEEGAAPRNEALRWFKSELGLMPPATREAEVRFLGMKPYHLVVCATLALFVVVMIWMYLLKMRRAAALLQALASSPKAEEEGSG